MLRKTLIRSTIVAVVLILVHEFIDFVARLLYKQPSGVRPGDIQEYNSMIANYADWIFTFILVGVWILLYLRDHRPEYRQLCIQIATILGIFTLLDTIKIMLTPRMAGTLSVDVAWIVVLAPLSFIKKAVLTGLMAAAVIAVINRRQPALEESDEERPMSSSDVRDPKMTGESFLVPLSGKTAHLKMWIFAAAILVIYLGIVTFDFCVLCDMGKRFGDPCGLFIVLTCPPLFPILTLVHNAYQMYLVSVVLGGSAYFFAGKFIGKWLFK